MNKRTLKALRDLNAYIDDDRQMLCDRIKGLEKSHKRMVSVLKAVRDVLNRDLSLCEVANIGLCVDFRVSDALIILNKELERRVL